MRQARSSDSAAAGTEAGWSSHLVKLRTRAPWSCAVWIQSIHGRRFAASTGAVAPRVENGHRRVHQPDIAVHDRAHRTARSLVITVRDRDSVLLVQTQQH